MSIADYILEIAINLSSTLLGNLPDSFGGVSASDFSNNIYRGLQTITGSWNFIENFFPIGLVVSLTLVIIIAEISLHTGFKGFKYIIKLIFGRG
jgi:hypothetical protein